MSFCIAFIYVLCVVLVIIAICLLYIGVTDMVEIPNNTGYQKTSGRAVSCEVTDTSGWWIFTRYNVIVDYNVSFDKKIFSGSTNIKTRDPSLCDIYNSPTYKPEIYYDPNNIELTTLKNNSKTIEIVKIIFGCIFIILAILLLLLRNKICAKFE